MSQPLIPKFSDIDTLLRSTAGAMTYPATPNIAARARLAIDNDEDRRLLGLVRLPLLRAAAVALVLAFMAAAVALMTPQSREALADFFGLSHVKVEIGPVLGPPPPLLSPASFSEQATLAEARRAVDFEVLLPAPDGVPVRPDAVYIDGLETDLPVVILVYERAGYDLYVTRRGVFGKGGVDEDLLHETTVSGAPALWFDEGDRIARSFDAQGRILIETERSVERATLFWEVDGITYRLETSLPEEEAIRVAESLQ